MKANNVEELFGTLQQSVVAEWRKHLKTSKYSKHMALDEYYKEMLEKVDKLIEDYMGHNKEKLNDYKNVLDAEDYNALEYLETLHELVESGRSLLGGASELESDLDDILGCIDSTSYKLRELDENSSMKSLSDFLNESLVNESKEYVLFVPCTEPDNMGDIQQALKETFGSSASLDKAGWTFGDESVRCYVKVNSEQKLKKFCEEWDADYETT